MTASLRGFLEHIGRLAGRGGTEPVADAALLERYRRERDRYCAASADVIRLADGAFPRRGGLPITATLTVALGLGLALVGLAIFRRGAADPVALGAVAAAAAVQEHDEGLPAGALGRLGTDRQRASGASIALTKDGKEVVTIGPELTVRRFDAHTGALLAARQLPRRRTTDVWLSPQGTYALAANFASGEYTLELWDLSRGSRAGALPLGRLHAWGGGASFSLDERLVAVPLSDASQRKQQIMVWDIAADRSRVLWSHDEFFTSRFIEPFVNLSPDGRRLLGCHLDRVLRCWDVESGAVLWEKQKNDLELLFFTPDGSRIIVSAWHGARNTIDFIDAASGEVTTGKGKLPGDLRFPVELSRDGKSLAFEDGQDGLAVWDLANDRVAGRVPAPSQKSSILTIRRRPSNISFTPDGKAVVRRSGILQRWDLSSGKPVFPDTSDLGHTATVTRLLFAQDGRTLASLGNDQTVRLWDVPALRPRHAFATASGRQLTFTPDGRHVLAAPGDAFKTAVRMWDVVTGRVVRDFERPVQDGLGSSSGDRELIVTRDGMHVHSLTFKNGRRGDECMLTTWESESGQTVTHRRAPWVEDSRLSADGRSVLALDARSQLMRLLDVATEEVRLVFETDRPADPQERVWSSRSALSPDGRLAAFHLRFQRSPGGGRGPDYPEYEEVRVADVRTGRGLLKIRSVGEAVFDFSRDSRVFAVADHRSLRLWETATWKEVATREAFNRELLPIDEPMAAALAFAPDGRTLATGHADGTILVWDAALRSGRRGGGALSSAQMESLWTDLGARDAIRAHAALWALVEDPERSVPFLRERLQPAAAPASDLVRRLLRDLESDRFDARQAAEKGLRALGEPAIPAMQAALRDNASLEGKRRIEGILKSIEQPGAWTDEGLRAWWGVWVLELAGTPAARSVLERLAGGAEGLLTRTARESLKRFKPR